MKHLLSILLISTLFAGELEIEGNLKVTGNIEANQIESQTIIELQNQIAALQAQITILQMQLGMADCFGVIGGDAVYDICGVCGGDGFNEDGSNGKCYTIFGARYGRVNCKRTWSHSY